MDASAWIPAVAALVGAAIGAGGALLSDVLRAKRILENDARAAARAWRDDFYAFQLRLGRSIDGSTALSDDSLDALGTNANFLSLTKALRGDGWSMVAKARRSLLEARADPTSFEKIRDASELFWLLQVAREYLATDDPSYGVDHPSSGLFNARPHTYHKPRKVNTMWAWQQNRLRRFWDRD